MSTSIKTITSPQIPLDLGIEVQKDINGIEMGVLENGIPYLTQRGLATVTGAPPGYHSNNHEGVGRKLSKRGHRQR